MERYFILASALLVLMTSCQASSTSTPSPASKPTPFEGSARVELDDITMYFESHGSGEPLLLLHGGFGSADVWFNQVPEFSKYYRVITPDSRAQGRTTDSDAPITYHQMAEDTVKLMDHLGIDSAYVVGWSDGAVIGIDMAIHHPERVKALVSYAGTISADGNQEGFTQYARTVTAAQIKQWFEGDYKKSVPGTDYLGMMPDPERLPIILEKVRSLWLMDPGFTTEELASIKAPTLVMDGVNDDLVRPEHAQVIADAIPGAQLVILPGTGHYAVLDKPEEWNKVVLDFLKGLQP